MEEQKSSSILLKYKTKSARVKGISFHPNRPWVLASLHTGIIQLWDYRLQTLLDKFEEHEGPVRGVDFHNSQTLFVSGGDDCKVKVWNFKTKKCLFTLTGHLDYIRTVQFHHDLPWLLSAADDQTCRIWNWQSRSCIAAITGHNHYVMCARFHPKDDLIISASLDQTVRVWDFKSLKQKHAAAGSSHRPSDIFSGTDVTVKFILEGHERGVNWASFHATSPHIVTGADDRTVRLWRYTENQSWEIDSMRGHLNNVSCVLFHPKAEIILSNSEDKSIRIWDMNRRTQVASYKKDDRFWIMATHPRQNLIAAGSDVGLFIFKIEKERVANFRIKNLVFCVYKKVLKVFDGEKETMITSIQPPGKSVLNNNPSYMLVNIHTTHEYQVLLQFEQDGGHYFLYQFAKKISENMSISLEQGQSIAIVFSGKDKVVLLSKNKELFVMNTTNKNKKKLTFQQGIPDYIFPAGPGKILVKVEDILYLYDITPRKVLAEISFSKCKQVVWTQNWNFVALLSPKSVALYNKNLEMLAHSSKERIGIKTGIWDVNGAFVYNTFMHLKFILPNGHQGIIRSLDDALYMTKISDNELWYLDREGKHAKLDVNTSEYRLKLALATSRFQEVDRILKSGAIQGQSLINYLEQQGFPDIAISFVQDEKAKFNLAVKAGIIEHAVSSAYQLNSNECWIKLADEALKQGSNQMVELAYQKTKNFEKLSFLYAVTGNLQKLRKMQDIASVRGDVMSRFHNSLLTGDVRERVKILAEVGQIPLAFVTARTHGLTDMLEPLKQSLQGREDLLEQLEQMIQTSNSKALIPPIPLLSEAEGSTDNWPVLSMTGSEFETKKMQQDPPNPYVTTDELPVQSQPSKSQSQQPTQMFQENQNWGGDIDFELPAESEQKPQENQWQTEDFEIPDVEIQQTVQQTEQFDQTKQTQLEKFQKICKLPGQLVAIGAFKQAMIQLTKFVGVTYFEPYKEIFIDIYRQSHIALPLLSGVGYVQDAFLLQAQMPYVGLTLQSLSVSLKNAYKYFSNADFVNAESEFKKILISIPLLALNKESELNNVLELQRICVEYLTAIKLENEKKQFEQDNKIEKSLEMTVLMCFCQLTPQHKSLVLRTAIAKCYKAKNNKATSHLCKKLLELAKTNTDLFQQDVIDKHKKLQAYCTQNFTDALNLDLPEGWDKSETISMCLISMTTLNPSQNTSKCPLCGIKYKREYKSQRCVMCGVSEIGMDSLGLTIVVSS